MMFLTQHQYFILIHVYLDTASAATVALPRHIHVHVYMAYKLKHCYIIGNTNAVFF